MPGHDGVNWDYLERYLQNIPTPASSFYASLTGTGETEEYGALEQTGPFTVDVPSGDVGSIELTQESAGAGITIQTTNALGSEGITIEDDQTIFPGCGVKIGAKKIVAIEVPDVLINVSAKNLTYASPAGVQIVGDNPDAVLGFFGADGAVQQNGSVITTVAQLVAALQAYGLLS